jgi:purine-nucleoside phosphorylase
MLQAARDYVRTRISAEPKVAVVLGSGLGAFADELRGATSIAYDDIPGWPRSTAIGHAGRLVFGSLDGVDIAVMSGRSHLYEGYDSGRITFGLRVLKTLGAQSVVLTNAAGGINLAYQQGALVLISDHINLQGVNPLAGANLDELGPRFPDMTEAYSPAHRRIAKEAAAQLGVDLQEGVYAAMLGPSYETPAEIRFLKVIGADLVGMSTVPETIVANHMGMKVLAISVVTNMAAGILNRKINHEEVLETGARVRGTLIQLLKKVIPRLET